jgi:hypothetical protein
MIAAAAAATNGFLKLLDSFTHRVRNKRKRRIRQFVVVVFVANFAHTSIRASSFLLSSPYYFLWQLWQQQNHFTATANTATTDLP